MHAREGVKIKQTNVDADPTILQILNLVTFVFVFLFNIITFSHDWQSIVIIVLSNDVSDRPCGKL